MKELIEKIVERLEKAKFDGNYTEAIWHRHGINKAIDIITEEAKAYNESVKGDLISRSALLKQFTEATQYACGTVGIKFVDELINNQPTAYNDECIPISTHSVKKVKKQTNADRIRSMNDEELADYLYKMALASLTVVEVDSMEIAIPKLLKWLQSEVE